MIQALVRENSRAISILAERGILIAIVALSPGPIPQAVDELMICCLEGHFSAPLRADRYSDKLE